MGLGAWVKASSNAFISTLFEPPCAACRGILTRPLDGAVCEACWSSIRVLPLDQHFDAAHAIAWSTAVAAYEERMKDIIHALKYDRRHSISPRLGALMREAGAAMLGDADCVVPVPLHPFREYRRGFNQAEALALHLGPPVARLLKRIVHTPSQIDLPKEQRLANVNGAFALADPGSRLSAFAAGWPLRGDLAVARSASGGGPVPGVVVLIDDVATTGATLESCARTLRRGGVKEVRALTAARVVHAPR